MFRPRIIPVLLLRNKALVKSIKFKNYQYIGDPINAVRIFNDLKADELVFLDILASKEHRTISLKFIEEVGEEANMPFSVGGGIRSLNSIQEILSTGAEKVIINQFAIENPNFIKDASDNFGSSTIMVCIDVKKNYLNRTKVWSKSNKKFTKYSPVDFAKLMEEKGAGEIIIQSVNRDGTKSGYDLNLLRRISENVSIPVTALGGASDLENMKQAYEQSYVNGLAAGSMFVFQGAHRGVLINYPEKNVIKQLFDH